MVIVFCLNLTPVRLAAVFWPLNHLFQRWFYGWLIRSPVPALACRRVVLWLPFAVAVVIYSPRPGQK